MEREQLQIDTVEGNVDTGGSRLRGMWGGRVNEWTVVAMLRVLVDTC